MSPYSILSLNNETIFSFCGPRGRARRRVAEIYYHDTMPSILRLHVLQIVTDRVGFDCPYVAM